MIILFIPWLGIDKNSLSVIRWQSMTKNIFTSNANLIKINHQPPSERNNYFSQSKISIVFQASQVILSEIKNTFSSQLHKSAHRDQCWIIMTIFGDQYMGWPWGWWQSQQQLQLESTTPQQCAVQYIYWWSLGNYGADSLDCFQIFNGGDEGY